MIIPNLTLSRDWRTFNHLVYRRKPRIISPPRLNTLGFTAKLQGHYGRLICKCVLFVFFRDKLNTLLSTRIWSVFFDSRISPSYPVNTWVLEYWVFDFLRSTAETHPRIIYQPTASTDFRRNRDLTLSTSDHSLYSKMISIFFLPD